jgi:hypothetical protein
VHSQDGILPVNGRSVNHFEVRKHNPEVYWLNLIRFEGVGEHVVDDVKVLDLLLLRFHLMVVFIDHADHRQKQFDVGGVFPQVHDLHIQCFDVVRVLNDMPRDVLCFPLVHLLGVKPF